MAKLNDTIRRDIVQRLACFDTPSEIAAACKEEYGVEISRQAVEAYDPARRSKLKKEWKELHTATRAAFLKDTSAIPIAQRSYRLRELGKLYRRVTSGPRPNIPLGLQTLEQGAKEVGEAFTNKRVFESGDPVAALAKLLGITPEELAHAIVTEGPALGAAP